MEYIRPAPGLCVERTYRPTFTSAARASRRGKGRSEKYMLDIGQCATLTPVFLNASRYSGLDEHGQSSQVVGVGTLTQYECSEPLDFDLSCNRATDVVSWAFSE